MSSDRFSFKQFVVVQRFSAMKVGTDGVLLGSWAALRGDEKNILDVGSGTGLIALMIAQRSSSSGAAIDAVEVECGAAREAKDNFKASPWSDRLELYESDFQNFARTKERLQTYDLIVSNPPYFNGTYKSQQAERTAARHTELLSSEDLIAGVIKLIEPQNGRFAAIFPYENAAIFIAKAAASGLFCNRLLEILPKSGRSPKRMAAEFSLHKHQLEAQSITILDSNGECTEQYRALTGDFYLKF